METSLYIVNNPTNEALWVGDIPGLFQPGENQVELTADQAAIVELNAVLTVTPAPSVAEVKAAKKAEKASAEQQAE